MKRLLSILCILLTLSMLAVPAAATEVVEEASLYEYLPTVHGNRVLSNKEDSPLWGKSALFLGDSICCNRAEQQISPLTAGWPGRIGPAYDMRWKNVGYSGATVSLTRDNNTTDQLLSERGTQYDLLVFQGGINDAYSGVSLGRMQPEDVRDVESFQLNTYAGSLEGLFARAKREFRGAKLFYIIHHTTPNSKSSSDLSKPNVPKGNPQDYVNLTRAICEKWGVYYLNLYDDETFNTEIFDTANNLKNCMWPDLLHMSSHGYDVLTPYIISFMEDALLKEENAEFLQLVDALDTEQTPEERFTALRRAIELYTAMNDSEKGFFDDEYDTLYFAIDDYNTLAEEINTDASAATDIVPLLCMSRANDLLAGLWLSTKNKKKD